MAHSYRCNYGHLVFHVENVDIYTENLKRVHSYLRETAMQLGVQNVVVGGTNDHVHMLGNFPVTEALCNVVKKIKAYSSHWISHLHSRYTRFSWQSGYGYFSVSASHFPRVAQYIANQEEHHRHMTALEEYERLIAKYSQVWENDA